MVYQRKVDEFDLLTNKFFGHKDWISVLALLDAT